MAEAAFSGPVSGLRDRCACAAAWSAALLISATFCWILGDLLVRGAGQLSWSFLLEPPRDAGRQGGISTILVSTSGILAVCMATALPLGLATAVLLAEFGGRRARFAAFVRRSLDVLAGVPSIVFGLFGNAFFCVTLGLGFSLLSGGLTLACMVLPLLIRSTEQSLRAVPAEYRLGAAALGMTRTAALRRILLPAAMPGLVAGFILGLGRALAETAALLFTSGYVDRMPGSLLDSGRALSVHVYDLAMNVPGGDGNAYATALALVGILLLTNSAAAWLGTRLGHGEVSR